MDRPARDLAGRFAIALAAEVLFIVGRTAIVRGIDPGIPQELAWNAWRIPFIAVYAVLARPFLFPARERRPMPRHPLLLLALLLSLADVPLAHSSTPWDYRLVLAATAFIPAIREELVYRVIVQGFLERGIGPVKSIVVASVAFTAYHFGSRPLGLLEIAGIFAAGMVLGTIYQRTRSLVVVASLHTVIDVLFALSPSFGYSAGAALACELLACIWVLAWWRLDVERAGVNWR